jgi:hypothetical protein
VYTPVQPLAARGYTVSTTDHFRCLRLVVDVLSYKHRITYMSTITRLAQPKLIALTVLLGLGLVGVSAYAQSPTDPTAPADTDRVAPVAMPATMPPITGPLDPGSSGPVPATIVATPNSEGQMRNRARMSNLAANLSTRMENTHRRLLDIQRRLEARRAIIASGGADTTASLNALAQASTSLAQVATRLATIDSDVAMGVGAMDVPRAWGTLRNTYSTMQTDLVAAHAALITALTALKAASEANSATTTTESR